MRWLTLLAVLVFPGILMFPGCDGLTPRDRVVREVDNPKAVYPVSGRVLVDGRPISELVVRLVPASATQADPSHPKALTDAAGVFEFSTYLKGDGVPADSYRVLVEQLTRRGPTMWVGPDRLNNLYNHLDAPATNITVNKERPQKNLLITLKVEGLPPKPAPPGAASRIGRPSGQ